MKMREPLLLVMIIAVALVSCARYPNIPRVEEVPVQGEQTSSTIEAGEKDYVIGPEDILEIQV